MIGYEFGSVNWTVIVGILLFILLVLCLVARRLGWLPKRRVLSGSPPVGNRVSHRAEAIVLFCVAVATFIFTATNTSTGGLLLILDQLRPELARTHIIVAVVAALGVLGGVLAAFFWRTSTGVILAAGALGIYGMVLNGSDVILESLTPDKSTAREGPLVFVLTTPELEGAELYVNNVHLGMLPNETAFEEFHQKVPYWETEPNELRRGNDLQSWLHVPTRWHPGNSEPSTQGYPPWAEINVPRHAPQWDQPGQSRAARKATTYYARVKRGEEWGYWDLHGGNHTVGGQYEQRTTIVPLGFVFPARQERIETLLDVARLNDYAPGPEWFGAMETYGSDGWIAVRTAMDKEPPMLEVLDRWARWRYDLDLATDPESAWQVFESIRAEANQRQSYKTTDIAGRAVELLALRLDPDKLIRLALRIARRGWFYNWYSWRMNGRTQFGVSFRPGGFQTGADSVLNQYAWGRDERKLSPGDYAIAHALWMLDQTLDARDDTQPNTVERDLMPALLARHYDNANLVGIAARIGGPAIEQYLLRQNWHTDWEDLPWQQRIGMGATRKVNGWLHLLAQLTSSAGRQFRQENRQLLMEMADRIVGDTVSSVFWDRGIEFLFLDLDLGGESLAMRYWPRFKEATTREQREALSLRYQYLVRMEPLSTADTYVRCWKEFQGYETTFYEALDVFAKSSVPYRKRERIYTALAEHIERDVKNVHSLDRRDEEDQCKDLLMRLKEKLLPITDPERARDLLAELWMNSPKYKSEDVAAWLAHGAPTHPLVGMLADVNEPRLRVLALGALQEHPTPENRAILQKLLGDPDEEVRRAAEGVAAKLTTLRETPIAQFADR